MVMRIIQRTALNSSMARTILSGLGRRKEHCAREGASLATFRRADKWLEFVLGANLFPD